MYQLYYYNTILTLAQSNPHALTPPHPHTLTPSHPTLTLTHPQVFGISKKFQKNFGEISSNKNECSHIHPNLRPETYENFGNFKEISEKFRGNFIKHNNECIHIDPNPKPEIYGNFRNFSESSEIITSSDSWGLGLDVYDYCSN